MTLREEVEKALKSKWDSCKPRPAHMRVVADDLDGHIMVKGVAVDYHRGVFDLRTEKTEVSTWNAQRLDEIADELESRGFEPRGAGARDGDDVRDAVRGALETQSNNVERLSALVREVVEHIESIDEPSRAEKYLLNRAKKALD